MSSIFEEMMTANHSLTESLDFNKSKRKTTEGRKISCNKIKVESRKIFEDQDLDTLEKEFEVPEEGSPDEVVMIIDPDLPEDEEVPEDAAVEMVGDLVYKCPICGSNYVCDCDDEVYEGVEVDEFGVPTECPICGDDADQILIGEIAPAEDAPGEETDLPPQKPEDDDTLDDFDLEGEEEVVEEDLDISVSTDDEGKVDEVTVEEDGETVVDEVVDEEDSSEEKTSDEGEIFEEGGFKKVCPKCHKDVDYCECKMNESLGSDVGKYQKWVDYDMKRYGKISDKTKGLLKKAGLEVVKDKYGDYEVIASDKKTEGFDGCDDCEDDVLVLDTPEDPKESEGPDVVVKDSEVTMILDDAKFESLIVKMLRENYKGRPSFRITKASCRKNYLRLEYVVRSDKSSKRGVLVGEGFNPESRVMKIKFRDKGVFNESLRKSPAMIVEFVRISNKVIPTKMSYDYKVKVKESLYRVSGKVGF